MPLAFQGRSASVAHTRAGGGCCVPPHCSTAPADAGVADVDAAVGADVGVDAAREEEVAVEVVATEASVATHPAAHDAPVARGSRCC
jgi:hypothetical protein